MATQLDRLTAPQARARSGAGRLLRRAGRGLVEYFPALLLLVGLVAFWELWVRWRDIETYLLPAPSAIWASFLEIRGLLPGHIRTTLTEALYGLGLAAALGLTLATLLASIPFTRRVLYPLMVVSQNIPMIVLAPLITIWFGFGIMPKVLVVMLVGFFPIVVSTTEGLLRADREMVDLVRSMGANRFQVLRHVLIPSATPAFFAGLKIAATYAVLAAVFAEWMGGQSGLGLFILRSSSAFRTDQVFVATVVIALTSIGLFLAVHLLARLASPWAYINDTQEDD